MKAKRFEHEVQEGQKKSVGDILKEKLKQMKLPEARVSPEFIDASQKKFIFVDTNNVSLEVKFGKANETKAIIPIMPTTGFSNVMMFQKIRSDDTFADFFDKVLKPKDPLFKMPKRTVIFIKELICADFTYKNFILPFDIPRFWLDFYYSTNGITYGIDSIGKTQFSRDMLDDMLFEELFSEENRIWLVDTLLKLGANPNAPKAESYGATLLSFAIAKNKIEIVKLLVDAQADLNKKFRGDFTPLYKAAANGSIDIVRLLLQAGADAMLLPRPDALAEIAKKPEIWKLLTAAMRHSPKFKKELQTLQRKVACDVWIGRKPDDVIKQYLPEFRARLLVAN
jgi:hypothetical protein